MNNVKMEDTYWDQKEVEVLVHRDMDEAVEMLLDAYHPDPIPTVLTIWHWRRTAITTTLDTEVLLESFIESLDEKYGNPEDEWGKITDGMRKAADVFAAAVIKEYTPWTCEPFESKEIDTRKWVKENAAHWLDEGLKFQTPDKR